MTHFYAPKYFNVMELDEDSSLNVIIDIYIYTCTY